MNTIPYTYSVIKYVHDPAAGEMLNVGVVLLAPSIKYMDVRVEYRYERLSETFAGFDGEHFKRALRQLEMAVDILRQRLADTLFQMHEPLADVVALGALIWPDQDLSFRFGSMLAGVTEDPEDALERLFDRFVVSQSPERHRERRTDEQVWATYQESLAKEKIHRVLKPKTFVAEGFELKFEHTFKNERWHVLQPVSMDYARVDGMRNKITRVLGNATALQDNSEIGTLYVLLGAPQSEAHRADYEKAKRLLNKMPVQHELVEEAQASKFANELASYMRQHGVIDHQQDDKPSE